MPLASLTGIEKTFGKRVLFDGLELSLERGERVGLIGDNGAGKTSIFRLLTRELLPDAGKVFVSDSVKVGHLSQEPVFDPANTVIDEAELAFARLHDLAHRMRDAEHEMAGQTGEQLEKTLNRYQTLQHDFDLAGGYAWRHRLEATLLGVGLGPQTWEQKVTTLSGGQRSRLALAGLLMAEPDLLLLDEPTNHLDLAAVEWLENSLLAFKGSVLLISHDRYLLDRLATRIVWLHQCRLDSYPGNYSAFVEQRALAELTQERQFERQQADIEKTREFIRRFGAGQRAREAQGREKRLNRLLKSDAMVAAVEGQRKIRLSLDSDQRAGDQVLVVRDLGKSYDGRALWGSLNFQLGRGDRVGVIGPNGSGKTTLLEVLLGNREPDAGHVKWGANLSVGYYDQRLGNLDPQSTVIDEVWADRTTREQEVRDVLALMLFRGEDIYKPVGLLSGGERARVRLAQLLLDRPNVLVLDEPTNHLDIASTEGLEVALRDFSGTILCVSHDRYFLDRAATRLLVLRPPDAVSFDGNYSAWTRKLAEESAAANEAARAKSSPPAKPRPAAPKPRAADNAYARPFGRLSMNELERSITETEVALADCQQGFANADRVREPAHRKRLQEEYDALSRKLKQLETEYYGR